MSSNKRRRLILATWLFGALVEQRQYVLALLPGRFHQIGYLLLRLRLELLVDDGRQVDNDVVTSGQHARFQATGAHLDTIAPLIHLLIINQGSIWPTN